MLGHLKENEISITPIQSGYTVDNVVNYIFQIISAFRRLFRSKYYYAAWVEQENIMVWILRFENINVSSWRIHPKCYKIHINYSIHFAYSLI